MSEFDAAAFTREIERAGFKLTATPLADGKYRVGRWSMINADRHQVDKLWAAKVGDNPQRLDLLARHLVCRPAEPRPLLAPRLGSLSTKPGLPD
jgi:hypothetical protein